MLPKKSSKFEMGRVVMTRSIGEAVAGSAQFAKEIVNALQRYKNCDWGNLTTGDKKLNDEAVKSGNDRILAAFLTPMGKVYIVTEHDRSYTTLMFSVEY